MSRRRVGPVAWLAFALLGLAAVACFWLADLSESLQNWHRWRGFKAL